MGPLHTLLEPSWRPPESGSGLGRPPISDIGCQTLQLPFGRTPVCNPRGVPFKQSRALINRFALSSRSKQEVNVTRENMPARRCTYRTGQEATGWLRVNNLTGATRRVLNLFDQEPSYTVDRRKKNPRDTSSRTVGPSYARKAVAAHPPPRWGHTAATLALGATWSDGSVFEVWKDA